jgi:hypothetical protein
MPVSTVQLRVEEKNPPHRRDDPAARRGDGRDAARALAFVPSSLNASIHELIGNLMIRRLTNMPPDFSAQFRPRYEWNDDVMRSAWWWTMWWPWVSMGILPSLPAPQPYGLAAILGKAADDI